MVQVTNVIEARSLLLEAMRRAQAEGKRLIATRPGGIVNSLLAEIGLQGRIAADTVNLALFGLIDDKQVLCTERDDVHAVDPESGRRIKVQAYEYDVAA